MLKTTIAAGITVAFALGAGPAYADCAVSQKEFENSVVAGKLRGDHFQGLVKELRGLREAAATLAKFGKEDACEEVIEALEEIVENPPKDAALRSVSELGGKLRVDEILDAEIRSKDNKYIGNVENIIVDSSGAPGYVIVEHGGFLGLGEEQAAIPFNALKVSASRDAFFLPVTEAQFEKAPRFQRNAFNWAGDESWRDRVDDYYKSN